MTNRITKMALTLLFALLPLVSYPMKARDAVVERFKGDYKKKFVVVLREGMAVGFIANPNGPPVFGFSVVYVDGNHAEVCPLDEKGRMPGPCLNASTQPVRRGEVFRVVRTFVNGKESEFGLNLTTVSPHSVQRGIGAYGHESLERGEMAVIFKVSDTGDYSHIRVQIDNWLKPFETADEAVRFGNTASGVFVREVKLGMTFAEVEQALGLPETRVELNNKILYKYKDMTVEFHDGKVTDVR